MISRTKANYSLRDLARAARIREDGRHKERLLSLLMFQARGLHTQDSSNLDTNGRACGFRYAFAATSSSTIEGQRGKASTSPSASRISPARETFERARRKVLTDVGFHAGDALLRLAGRRAFDDYKAIFATVPEAN